MKHIMEWANWSKFSKCLWLLDFMCNHIKHSFNFHRLPVLSTTLLAPTNLHKFYRPQTYDSPMDISKKYDPSMRDMCGSNHHYYVNIHHYRHTCDYRVIIECRANYRMCICSQTKYCDKCPDRGHGRCVKDTH